MARTNIPVQVIPANGGVDQAIAWTAGDATNDHEFSNSGRELLLMKSDAVGAKHADVMSVADEHGRIGDTSLDPDGDQAVAIAGPFLPTVWNQAGGLVNVDLVTDTDVFFAVVQYNSNFS